MKSNQEIIEKLLSRIDHFSYIREQDIPDIDLYMDQVTSFLDEHLSGNKRHPEDKALTKTMINNYAKNHLLPAPNKKKYSKDHLLLLIFIYYYKNLISLSDIQMLFKPLLSMGNFPGSEQNETQEKELSGLSRIYRKILPLEADNIRKIKPDIKDKYSKAAAEMKGIKCSEEEREYLTLFAFVSELALDVYAKKQMIEQIADELSAESAPVKIRKKKEKERAD